MQYMSNEICISFVFQTESVSIEKVISPTLPVT